MRDMERAHQDPWARENSPFTIEGQIEDYGKFARGLRYTSPARRWTARVLVGIVLLPLLIAGISAVGDLVVG